MSGVFQTKTEEEEIDRTPWGELEPSDEESSEEEEEEESDEDKPDETGFITPADRWGKQESLPLRSGLFVCGDLVSTPELVSLSTVASSSMVEQELKPKWPGSRGHTLRQPPQLPPKTGT